MTDADILTILYNNFDPRKPAASNFYVDCTAVRGGDVFAEKLCRDLSRSDVYIHTLFTGHVGCGKSSELAHIANKLDDPRPEIGHKRFLPIIVDTSEYLDRHDTTIEDILLAIVSETGEVFQEKLGIAFRENFLRKLLQSVDGLGLSSIETEVAAALPGHPVGASAKLKATFQRLQKDKSAKDKVRETLRNQTGTLLDEINSAFVDARIKLQNHVVRQFEKSYSDFVIILDNLEKVENFDGKPEGEASQHALFIANSFELTGIEAHTIYTVPLSLSRLEPSSLSQAYGDFPLVLPNIKTEQRGRPHARYEAGREKMTEILEKRMPVGVTVGSILTDEAREFLIENSGGHVRNFLLFAREAVSYTGTTLPIPLAAAHQAIRKTVSLFQTALNGDDWKWLVELETSQDQRWEATTPEKARLLEQLAVLEYENGGDADEFNDPAPWAAVNPLIRKMNPFKALVPTGVKIGVARRRDLRDDSN